MKVLILRLLNYTAIRLYGCLFILRDWPFRAFNNTLSSYFLFHLNILLTQNTKCVIVQGVNFFKYFFAWGYCLFLWNCLTFDSWRVSFFFTIFDILKYYVSEAIILELSPFIAVHAKCSRSLAFFPSVSARLHLSYL